MININTVIADLELSYDSVEVSASMQELINLFSKKKNIPGVIITKDGSFYNMISRNRFHEIMSKQFMFELFNKRKINYFVEADKQNELLILDGETSVALAANKALQRNDLSLLNPIIVQLNEKSYALLDFYKLIIAQSEIHLLTLDFLRQANEFKKDAIGIISHDLRNPLNAIIGFSSMLVEISEEGGEIKDYSQVIYETAHQMNGFITELLNLAADDSNSMILDKSEFELDELLRSIKETFIPQALKKNQTIILKIKNHEKYTIKADKRKISEVVENLVSNAIKYSYENRTIFLRLYKNQTHFILEVEDQGLGFSEDDLPKLFSKFQKLSARPTAGETSTGLGLYIVKKILDLHDAEISIKSEKNIGTTFTIKFPEYKWLVNYPAIMNRNLV